MGDRGLREIKIGMERGKFEFEKFCEVLILEISKIWMIIFLSF